MADFPVRIEDVCAVANLGVSIELDRLVSAGESPGYDTEHSTGVVYKIKDSTATALIFSSGKVVCTGAKSVEQAREAIVKVVERVKELGVDAPARPEIEIENIVALFVTKGAVNLEGLSSRLEGAQYGTGEMPGIVYRLDEPRADFLILERKIICTGGRSMRDVQRAMKVLMDKLKKAGVKVGLV